MKYHFEIIDLKAKQDPENIYKYIHTKSEDYMTSNGFGEEDNFTGWDSEVEARFWARDRMKLYSLTEETHEIKIIEKIYTPKPIIHNNDDGRYIPKLRGPYNKTEDSKWRAKIKRIGGARGSDKNTLV